MYNPNARRGRLIALTLVAAASAGGNCPAAVHRGGAAYDGSARWAWDKAQPVAAQNAADAELRQILATLVQTDGRLPANEGSWSFVCWSPSQQKTIQVTIAADGSPSTSIRAEAAPGPGIQRPLPAAWANSTDVFQAIVNAGVSLANATGAQLAVLNVASYSGVPNQAAWAINFQGSNPPNQVVRWDGTYVGPQ